MIINTRSHERVKVEGIVYYSDAFLEDAPQKDHEKHEGQAVDISPGGICICTQHEFERGSKMQFYIKEHYKGTFTGIVRWCVKSSYDNFHVGLKVPFSLKKILIVENEAIQGMAASDVLAKNGYDVLPVPFTGEEAIALINLSPPDLAIIDIALGDEIDGIQVARHLLEKRNVPIIYLTAHTENETIDKAKKTGPFGFIFKPYEDKDLLKMVADALNA